MKETKTFNTLGTVAVTANHVLSMKFIYLYIYYLFTFKFMYL